MGVAAERYGQAPAAHEQNVIAAACNRHGLDAIMHLRHLYARSKACIMKGTLVHAEQTRKINGDEARLRGSMAELIRWGLSYADLLNLPSETRSFIRALLTNKEHQDEFEGIMAGTSKLLTAKFAIAREI